MPSVRYIAITASFFLFLCQLTFPSFGQLGTSFDIKKPKEFENRVLRSEKSDKKKFKGAKKFIQNSITHYNYVFNTNNKLNEVIQRAKFSFKDDYAELLPFYNYSLDVTAADSIQLDSIVSKAKTGIVLHDLRSDWADNLYLMWGASYYLQKQFDSAYLMFQFINYAFAPKEKDGYYKTIGSARDGNKAYSISTKEKNSLARRAFSEPPSRNDAFIWQIRNHLAQDQFSEAASLILALKNDPAFPSRLKNDLEEVQAYSFYRQEYWDSSAAHLENALSNAPNQQEKARWEYLLGQLNETTKHFKEAEDWYGRAINHTTDPILDIYARLATVRVNKDGGENYIVKNIETLVKMAHRDKYSDYRDIIYYTVAQMELERDNLQGAIELLKRSTIYVSNNPAQRNKAFLQLAQLSLAQHKYRQSYNFYDSLKLEDPLLKDRDAIVEQKSTVGKVVENLDIIFRQDSLQYIASLPEKQRRDIVKKKVRQLRKLQGLKDEAVLTTGNAKADKDAPSLFDDNTKKGEWYFYNAASRQKGSTDFKSRWGSRPNVDNWRRATAVVANLSNMAKNNPGFQTSLAGGPANDKDITTDLLYDRLPLTEEKMKISNDSIEASMYSLGIIYIQKLEDCKSGTDTLEHLRTRFPQFDPMDQVLFNLYYCYNKNGETAQAALIKKTLNEQFPKSNLTEIVTTGTNTQLNSSKNEATQIYEKIYNQFIEGDFESALTNKNAADSIYGRNYWTPQLLYIESVYHIKKHEDSLAKISLANIVTQFEGTPIAAKASTMLDVLNRRASIEEELRNLVIVMPTEDSSNDKQLVIAPVRIYDTTRGIPIILPATKDSVVKAPPDAQIPKTVTDTTKNKTVVITPPALNYDFIAETPHYVVLVLNKVDPIFGNETKNAFGRYNRDTYYNKQMQADLVDIDKENRLLLISPFKNAAEALAYIEQTQPKTASEIIPWLTGGKYSFSIITDKNLEVLKASKDLDKYKQFLQKNLPGKFQ